MKLRMLGAFALAAAALAAAEGKSASEFAARWTATRKMAVGVADAMPPSEYAFRPDPPSMTFGECSMAGGAGHQTQ